MGHVSKILHILGTYFIYYISYILYYIFHTRGADGGVYGTHFQDIIYFDKIILCTDII